MAKITKIDLSEAENTPAAESKEIKLEDYLKRIEESEDFERVEGIQETLMLIRSLKEDTPQNKAIIGLILNNRTIEMELAFIKNAIAELISFLFTVKKLKTYDITKEAITGVMDDPINKEEINKFIETIGLKLSDDCDCEDCNCSNKEDDIIN